MLGFNGLFSCIFKGDWDFLTVAPAGFRCLWPPQNRSWVPGAHLQWESVSDTWQLFLEMCSVSRTVHSGCAVGLTGLKMTFSLPFSPHHQLGKLSWDTSVYSFLWNHCCSCNPNAQILVPLWREAVPPRIGWSHHRDPGNPQCLLSV